VKNTKQKKSIFPKIKDIHALTEEKFPNNWLDNSVQDNPYLSVHFLKKLNSIFYRFGKNLSFGFQ